MMGKREASSIVLISALVVSSGCLGFQDTGKSKEELAKQKCIQLCEEQNRNLSAGPCLSNNITDNWVCDVAHSPRKPVDNQPENQCPAFGATAEHFVEVDPNCNFIKAR